MSTDLFIIYYVKQSDRWSAFSAKTLKDGVGVTPKEALEVALAASGGRSNRHPNAPSQTLFQTLTKIAEPLCDTGYTTEAVYRYEQVWVK